MTILPSLRTYRLPVQRPFFRHLFATLLTLAVLATSTARAQTPQRIYELNGSYAETNGGSALVPNGGTLGTTGYTFGLGQGPNVSNALANTGEYSIEVVFRIDDTSNYRNLINFNNRTGDNAVYCFSGKVLLYNYLSGNSTTTDFIAGQTHRLVVTRNATTKVTTAYVNGVQKGQVTDSNNYYVASGTNGILHFFRDDSTSGEDASGFVDQIRIYHTVLTPTQVAALGQAPSTAPEIQLKGNSTVITDGDTTPSTTDHTQFGTVSSSLARTFTIENTGTAALTVSSIAVSGTHASQFVVSGAPSSVAAGSSSTFTVTFTPGSGTGARTATITVSTNDADEAAYDFGVEGTADAGVPAPTITSISPSSGGTLGGTRIAINGANLTGVTSVTVRGNPVSYLLFINDSRIIVDVPAGAEGPASVLVTTPGGTNAANSLYSYMPLPLVTGISPNRGTIRGGTSVTISGTGLSNPDFVQFGGVAGTIISSTATAITVVTPPRPVGPANVFVATAYGGSTSPGGFTYIVPPPGEVDPLNVSIVGTIVLSTVAQPDGRTLIAGNFSQMLGANRNHLARILSDGTLDPAFNPNPNGPVTTVAVQPDGKILLGGSFTALQPNGAASPTTRNRIARLNTDGTLDTSFNPNANAAVQCVVPQADGRILVGGAFNSLQPSGAASPTTRNYVARLQADGTLDPAFDPNPNDEVLSLAVQADGRVVLAGRFTTLQPNGAASATTRNRVARVNSDGSLDAGFNPNVNGVVNTLAIQADGGVVLGGQFGTLQPNGAASSTARQNIARVTATGALDATFDPRTNGAVNTLALQADGGVLLGGAFTTLQPAGAASTTTRNRVARVLADGTLDTGFDPNANNIVFSVALRSDGGVLLGGFFTTLQPNGATSPVARDYFVRLVNDAATQSLSTLNSSWAYWSRGGSAPELTSVHFEVSTDSGTTWSLLPGTAARVGASADWELLGTDFPPSGLLRGRGRTASSYQSGGSGLVEFQATYTAPIAPPAVTAVSPALGSTLGGDTVTITGSRFTDATAVTFGGSAAASFTVVNASTITAVTPAGVAGTASVRVTTTAGTNATNSLFTYVTPPTVTAVSPALGSTLGGASVTITGTGFVNVTGVKIGANAVASYVVDSATQITAVTPAATAGTASVTVQVPGAVSAANTLYTYIAPPTVTTVSPASGTALGGQTVTVTGTALSLVSSVTFGGVAAPSFTVQSATSLTAVTPAGSAGTVSVGVTSPGGTSATNSLYTYVAPATVTTLVSSQNPSVFLTPPTFTARVTSPMSGLNGQVALIADNVTLDTKPVDANGYATFTPAAAALHAGNRQIQAVFQPGTSAANYPTSSASLTQVVQKATLPVTLGNLNQTYDGSPKPASATVTAPGGFTVTATLTYQGSANAPTNAGTYGVNATIDHPDFTGAAAGSLVIAQAPLTFTLSSAPLVYNGGPRVPQLTYTPAGISVTLTYQSVVNGVPTGAASSVAPSLAGRYQANLAIADANHYLPVATVQFDVVKANAALTFTNIEQMYDGSPRVPIVFSDPLNIPLTLTYQPLQGGVPTGTASSQAPVAVGQYRVTATSPNHQVTPATAVLKVAKRAVTISIGGLSAAFDGQPKPVTVTTNPAGIPVTITYSGGGTTTSTAPSAPPAGGQFWGVHVVPTDSTSYSGGSTSFLRIDPKRQPTLVLTGPAVTTPSSSGSFIATIGSTGTTKPTGIVYFRTAEGFPVFIGGMGADGKVVLARKDYYLGARTAPYELIAEYSGDANYLPAVSNVLINRVEKEIKTFAEYPAFFFYTGRPTEIPPRALAFLYYNPSLVKSYQITYNGSTVLPTIASNSPYRLAVTYETRLWDTDYRDFIDLTILRPPARVKVGNLRQTLVPGGNPVQVTTDPAGLATRVTYNGQELPNGPTAAGTYSVVATLLDTSYTLLNVNQENSGTLVVTQDLARFTVTNLTQDYDGRPKSVSVVASPSIDYLVTYNGLAQNPTAPGTYDVRVSPRNTAVYGTGSNHTLVIRAQVSATVNGQAGTNFRLRDGAGRVFTSFPAFVSPNQNEWTLEFVDTDELRFVKWSDGSRENPRRISYGGSGDPARFTYNAVAIQLYFLKAQAVSTGLPSGASGVAVGQGYYPIGQLARFEATIGGDAIINRWEYNGKVLNPADGHVILRDGREVYIKVTANGGNPVCHFTAGYVAEGFANGGNGTPGGIVEIKRLDYPFLPVFSQRFMPLGVNYIATAKQESGFIFQGWESSDTSQLSDPFKRAGMAGVPGYPQPGISEEFMRVGSRRYSSVFPRFIKDGPEFEITVSNQKRRVSAGVSGVDIAGIRTADVTIRNQGKNATGVNLKRMKVTAFRVKRPNSSTWQYYYLNATGGEIDDNNRSNLTAGEKGLLFINQPVAINGSILNVFEPATALDSLVADNGNPATLDYPLGSIGYKGSKTVSILLGGSAQDVNFGLRAEINVRMHFTVETDQGQQEVRAWWTDFNPTE